MKTKLLLVLCLPFVAFAAPQNQQGMNAHQPCPRDQECPSASTTSDTPTTLSAVEIIAAIEEERLAHDIYIAAAQRWNLRVFTNIAAAEIRHAAALESLAESAGIMLPPVQAGVYVTPELQSMYHQLHSLVNESITGALQAGALIEETDIADLRDLMNQATDSRTRTVLANLERASIQHLNAFVQNLEAHGFKYEPRVFTPDEYAAVVGPAKAPRGGSGRGYRGGR
jgi:hypothetical protein